MANISIMDWINYKKSVGVEALHMIGYPGSGKSNMATGLMQKVDKAAAFRYSFLLAVPAILGATIFEAKDLATANVDLAPLLLGVTVSMIVGYISVKLLQKIVMKEKFHLFAYYCWTVGAAIIVFTIFQ